MRFQLNGPRECLDGGFQGSGPSRSLNASLVNQAKQEMRIRVVGIQLDGFLALSDRVVQAAGVGQRLSQRKMQAGALGIVLQSLLQFFDGSLPLSVEPQKLGQAEVVVGPCLIRRRCRVLRALKGGSHNQQGRE